MFPCIYLYLFWLISFMTFSVNKKYWRDTIWNYRPNENAFVNVMHLLFNLIYHRQYMPRTFSPVQFKPIIPFPLEHATTGETKTSDNNQLVSEIHNMNLGFPLFENTHTHLHLLVLFADGYSSVCLISTKSNFIR